MEIVLRDYQEQAVGALAPILGAKPIAILNGDVGVGKTIMSLETVKRLKPPAVGVIAPKIIVSAWRRTAEDMGVELAFCANPEILRTGRRPQIVMKEDRQGQYLYRFQLPPGSVLIFDELHRYGAMHSQLAYLLFGAKLSRCKVLGPTGTLGETPLKFRAILSLAEKVPWNDFQRWATAHGCYRDHNITGSPWRFGRGARGVGYMRELHDMLFPEFGVRLRVADIKDYPECDTQVGLYDLSADQLEKVNEIYAEMSDELKNPEREKHDLTKLLRMRQQVQMLKIPLFVDLTTELVEEGKSVVCFFDFLDPLFAFRDAVSAKLGYMIPLIYGDQKDRDQAIASFQSNEARVIGVVTAAGGVAVSLGDETGAYPRVGLLNVPIDGITATQACGRIHRATNKSKALNIFVMLAGSDVEERMARLLKSKLRTLATVQGDDLMSTLL